jgi:hypothetical protein
MKPEHDQNGVFLGISKQNPDGSFTFFGPGSRLWPEFLEQNSRAEKPIDLSDKPPEAPAIDIDIERIREILAKRDADITASEVKELLLKFVRKRL